MTQRSIRRAAERQTRKEVERRARMQMEWESAKELQCKAGNFADPPKQIQTTHATETESASSPQTPESHLSTTLDRANMSEEDVLEQARSFGRSPARIAANQANAQLSTGPKSTEGKSKSSLNAVKTALTGRTVLLPSEDAAAYERHIEAWRQDLQPVGARECDLVQSIADSAWRLQRVFCLESGIFALGHIEFAENFNDHAPDLRSSMIELHTFLKYEKQLRNLQIQEVRLATRRRQDLAELRDLQQGRRSVESEVEQAALELAAEQYLMAKTAGQALESPPNGFVFSTAQIELYLERARARQPHTSAMQHAA